MKKQPPSPPRGPWADRLSEDWPIYARLLGAGIGLAEMTAGFVGLPVSTPVLGFAGGLLLAPKIIGVQQRRNDRRDDPE